MRIHWVAIAFSCLIALAEPVSAAPGLKSAPDLRLLQSNDVTHLAAQPDGGLIVGAYGHQDIGETHFFSVWPPLVRLDSQGHYDPEWKAPYVQTLSWLLGGPDGSLYVGASRILGESGDGLKGIGRLDGTTGELDPDWGGSQSGQVWALAVDNDWVYAAGSIHLTGVGARPLIRISRVAGTIDMDWAPQVPAQSRQALVVDPGGMLYVAGGGYAETVWGRVNRIDIAAGATDPAWQVDANDFVTAITVDTDGNILVAGYFTQIGGQPRAGLAKLSPAGTVLPWNPAPDGFVSAIVVQDGDIFVAGEFRNIGGAARSGLARIAADGSADPNWRADLDGVANALVAGPRGLAVGGDFQAIGEETRLGVAILDPASTAVSPSDDVALAARVRSIVPDGIGGYLVSGRFARANGLIRTGLLRLDNELKLDPDWAVAIRGSVNAIAVDDASSSVYAGGTLTVTGGARNLLRLDRASAVLDETWRPDPDNAVMALAVRNGVLHAGGYFTHVAGQPRARLVRFQPGQQIPDAAWLPAPDNVVWSLAVAANGDVFAGGSFSKIGGESRPQGLARLAAANASAGGWVPQFDQGYAYSLELQPDDRLYVRGWMKRSGWPSNPKFLRLSAATGAVDTNWLMSPQMGNVAKVTNGGAWVTVESAEDGGLVRYSTATGGRDPGWFIGVDNNTYALADGPGGSLLVGGEFATVSVPTEASRYGLAAFSDDVIFQDGF